VSDRLRLRRNRRELHRIIGQVTRSRERWP